MIKNKILVLLIAVTIQTELFASQIANNNAPALPALPPRKRVTTSSSISPQLAPVQEEAQEDAWGFTPIMTAAFMNKPNRFAALLNSGASTKGTVKKGFYAGQTFEDLVADKPEIRAVYMQFKKSGIAPMSKNH